MSLVWIFVWIAILCGSVAMMPFWFARAIVWTLRTFHIFAFPDAMRLAVSLERDTDRWTFGSMEATHPEIGTLRTDDEISIRLTIDRDLTWRPNFIERQIVWDALQRVRARRVGVHLDRALPT